MFVKKVWRLKNPTSTLADRLAYDTGILPLLARLLVNRGISEHKTLHSFLNLRLSDMIDPMLLKGMDAALSLITSVIHDKGKITVFGDYDADGLTATALLVNFFSEIQTPVAYYIPERLREGYGLNQEAVKRMRAAGTDMIITVDCGSANENEIIFAREVGMRVVVTDHHQLPEKFQSVCPVINPHQADCGFPFKDLAGVGVAFYLAVALRGALRGQGWFKHRPEPDLRRYLDFVALGTVADRVPLVDQNRLLVTNGMEVMAKTKWPGLDALKTVADIRDNGITAEDLAFRMAPRLNAPGRIGSGHIVVRLLTTGDPEEARHLAWQINTDNINRQEMERDIVDQIEAWIQKNGGMDDRRVLFLGAPDWHPGVLGIVAAKLVDKYYRPAFIYCPQNGVAVGSGRSIDGFNLFENLSRCRHLFEKFGGHSHAAGFTLKTDYIKEVEKELESLAREMLGETDLIPVIDVDAELKLHDVDFEMIGAVNSLSPFGTGNAEPAFLSCSLKVLESRVLGGQHLRLRVRQNHDGKIFNAIGFGMGHRNSCDGKWIDMVFTPQINRWQGRENIQLRIRDLRETKGS